MPDRAQGDADWSRPRQANSCCGLCISAIYWDRMNGIVLSGGSGTRREMTLRRSLAIWLDSISVTASISIVTQSIRMRPS